MTLEEAQKQVDLWIKKYGVRYFSELTNMAVLTEEVGELARIMSRKNGRCTLGTSLHRQSNRCRSHRCLHPQSGKEDPKR